VVVLRRRRVLNWVERNVVVEKLDAMAASKLCVYKKIEYI
jgi:hypothetical protein